MKKTKLEKGIKLVALIITIIVLLILAVVSIGAIKNSKIISHSQNAADGWKKAQGNENKLLVDYLDEIESNLPESSKIYYFYTEAYYIEGENHCALAVFKDFGNNKKDVAFFIKINNQWYYDIHDYYFYEKTYTQDTWIDEIKIEVGKKAVIGYGSAESDNPLIIFIDGNDKIYFPDVNNEADLIEFNDTIKSIIDTAEPMQM